MCTFRKNWKFQMSEKAQIGSVQLKVSNESFKKLRVSYALRGAMGSDQ